MRVSGNYKDDKKKLSDNEYVSYCGNDAADMIFNNWHNRVKIIQNLCQTKMFNLYDYQHDIHVYLLMYQSG